MRRKTPGLSKPIDTVEIDESFKVDNGCGRYESERAWVELKIKLDERRGDYYIDVLMGTKGKDAHVHYGLNRDLSGRFFLPRDSLHTLGVRAVDSKRGVLEDSITRFKEGDGSNKVTFTVVVDDASRTIRVLFADVKLESNADAAA
jgi:hypothetical protein